MKEELGTLHESGRTILLKAMLVTAAAALAALLVALGTTQKPAEAAFPGKNGRIVFESNRTTGAGVDNPTGDYEIFTVKPGGTGLLQLTRNKVGDHGATYSPDGSKIAYFSSFSREGFSDYDIYTIPADGGTPTNVTDSPGCFIDEGCLVETDPAWAPDGSKMAFIANGQDIYTVSADGGQSTLLLDLDTLGEYPSVVNPPLSWSPDGSNVAFWDNTFDDDENPTGDGEIVTANSGGTGLTRLTDNVAEDGHPDHSPDGAKIAFSSDRSAGTGVNNPTGDDEVFTMNLVGTGVTQVTRNTNADFSPAWSPDGTRIAYAGQEGDDQEIFTISATGGGSPTNVSNDSGAYDARPDWQPLPRALGPTSKGLSGEGRKITDVLTERLDSTSERMAEVANKGPRHTLPARS